MWVVGVHQPAAVNLVARHFVTVPHSLWQWPFASIKRATSMHHDWNDTMPTAQYAFQSIPGLISCTGVTRRWTCMTTCIVQFGFKIWVDLQTCFWDYNSLYSYTHTHIYNPLSALSCKEIPIVIMTFQCIHVISDYTTHCLTCVVVSSSPLQLTMPCLCSCLSASVHVHVSGTLKLATFISHKTPSICHHTVVSLGYEANLCQS